MNNALKEKVKNLIGEVDKTHRYSMSRIYELYNQVFDKNEEPQSCASCLIRKVKELRTWLESQNRQQVDSIPASMEAPSHAEVKTKTAKTKKSNIRKES